MIDILLIAIGILFIVIGLLGCILPILPGPPLSYLALISIELSKHINIDNQTLWVLFGLTVVVIVFDYYLPIWVVKRTGGSKRAIWGATIGLLVGIFVLPPIGVILGPLLGAFIGELTNSSDTKKAIKGGLAAFGGLMLGTLLKLIVSGVITVLFIKEVWQFFQSSYPTV